jgi:hypothetical protein
MDAERFYSAIKLTQREPYSNSDEDGAPFHEHRQQRLILRTRRHKSRAWDW